MKFTKHLANFIFAVLLLLVLSSVNETAHARYAAIVIEPKSGAVLFSRNANTRNYPASLTKMMTLYLLFERVKTGKLKLTSKLRVSRRAARQPASKLGLKAGGILTVEQAIRALIVKSANDVATVVAENLAKSESKFAQKMTRKARRLGMIKTTFRNASGLPNRRQLSTARDMSKLALALQRDFPKFYPYFSERKFVWRGHTYNSHNKLLRYFNGTDGMKTGYIRASGFNLVASTKRDGRRLIGVVFGGKSPQSRNRHMRKLLELGFQRLGITKTAHRRNIRTYKLNRKFARVPNPAIRPNSEIIKTRIPQKTTLTGLSKNGMLASTARGKWSVQVGAYRRLSNAKQQIAWLSNSLPHLFKSRHGDIAKISRGNNAVFYCARFTGLPESQARKVCKVMAQKNLPCFTVPPIQASLNSKELPG